MINGSGNISGQLSDQAALNFGQIIIAFSQRLLQIAAPAVNDRPVFILQIPPDIKNGSFIPGTVKAVYFNRNGIRKIFPAEIARLYQSIGKEQR